jgi:hypothetical protein
MHSTYHNTTSSSDVPIIFNHELHCPIPTRDLPAAAKYISCVDGVAAMWHDGMPCTCETLVCLFQQGPGAMLQQQAVTNPKQ